MYIFLVGKMNKDKFELNHITASKGKAWRKATNINGQWAEVLTDSDMKKTDIKDILQDVPK